MNWNRGLFRLCFAVAFVIASTLYVILFIDEGEDIFIYWHQSLGSRFSRSRSRSGRRPYGRPTSWSPSPPATNRS